MKVIERPDTTVISGDELVLLLDAAVFAKTGRRVSHISGCHDTPTFQVGILEARHVVRLELVLHPKDTHDKA